MHTPIWRNVHLPLALPSIPLSIGGRGSRPDSALSGEALLVPVLEAPSAPVLLVLDAESWTEEACLAGFFLAFFAAAAAASAAASAAAATAATAVRSCDESMKNDIAASPSAHTVCSWR